MIEQRVPKPGDWILKDGDFVIAWAEDFGALTEIADNLESNEIYRFRSRKSRFKYYWTNPKYTVKRYNLKGAIFIVDGAVQGNGFKALARKRASDLNLDGIAWNWPDDKRVIIIVEGLEENIREFIKRLWDVNSSIFPIRISDIRVRWCKATGMYKGYETIRDENKLAKLMWLRRKVLHGH